MGMYGGVRVCLRVIAGDVRYCRCDLRLAVDQFFVGWVGACLFPLRADFPFLPRPPHLRLPTITPSPSRAHHFYLHPPKKQTNTPKPVIRTTVTREKDVMFTMFRGGKTETNLKPHKCGTEPLEKRTGPGRRCL
jgi:hypothetical protein